ncbi:MAG: hypothetical protein B6244_03720 [Candidatus Cloacimonetes bacterium 4572_55]|nr:MAG: hypothetical protein B6244_03720 [Candidatus Cloacimonetes bacterium 4572_55]
MTGLDNLDFWGWDSYNPDFVECGNRGDSGDPFQAGGAFTMATNPSSNFHKIVNNYYKGVEQNVHTGVAIRNIRNNGDHMLVDIYRNWYGGTLRSDLTLQGEVITGETLIVPAGRILTVTDSAVVTVWPSADIRVEDGGQLIVGASQIIAADENNVLYVYGALIANIDDQYNSGTPDEILISCIDHSTYFHAKHKVRKNYWGENYGEERFSPDIAGNGVYDSFEIEPVWDDPVRSGARELYLQAEEAVASENYGVASDLYQQELSDYFSSEEAKASIGQLYFIENATDRDFPTLRWFTRLQP